MTVNERLRDEALLHKIYLLRTADSITGEMYKAFMTALDEDLVDQIESRIGSLQGKPSPFQTEKYKKLVEFVRKAGSKHADKMEPWLTDRMEELAKEEVEWQAESIEDTIPIKWELAIPSPQMIHSLITTTPLQGSLLKDWISGWGEGKARRVNQALTLGLGEGQTADQIIRRIRGTKSSNFTDGVLGISRRGAATLVRTASNEFTNKAKDVLFADNDDLVAKWQFVATLDSSTTPICRALDGKVFPLGEGPKPPRHFSCRSVQVPVLKDAEEIFGPNSKIKVKQPEFDRPYVLNQMSGKVPATTTYTDWLRRQTSEVQDDILGPLRGQLFREHKLHLDKFVDMNTGALKPVEVVKAEAELAKAKVEQVPTPKLKPVTVPEGSEKYLIDKSKTVVKSLTDTEADAIMSYTKTCVE